MPSRLVAISWIGLALIAAAFLALVNRYASNTPQGDDFGALLEPAVRWGETTSWRDRVALLAEQHFSHRLVLTKTIVVAQVALSGAVNFLVLQWLGWLAFVAVVAALVWHSPEVRAAPWLALPIALLVFQPQGFTNFHSAMQSLQNLGILAVALGAFVAVTAVSSRWRAVSLPLAALAAFTSANGLLVGPIAALTAWLQRRRSLSLAHAALTAVVATSYFSGFHVTPAQFSLTEFLAKVCIMAGTPWTFERLPLWFAVAAGALVLAAGSALLLREKLAGCAPVLRAFLAFALASIALAALGRLGLVNDYMTQDRYRIYGLLVIAVSYLLFLSHSGSRRLSIRVAALATAGAFSAASFAVASPAMASRFNWTEAQALNAQLGQPFFLTSGGGWDDAARTLHRAASAGLYRFPESLSTDELSLLHAPPASPARAPLAATPDGGVLGHIVFTDLAAGEPRPLFATILVSNRPVVLPVVLLRASIGETLREQRLLSRRFGFVLPQEIPAAATSTLIAYVRDGDGRLTPHWHATVTIPRAALSS